MYFTFEKPALLSDNSLLISLVELLLMLLRDDNVFVRQAASEMTTTLINKPNLDPEFAQGKPFFADTEDESRKPLSVWISVIPLVAEDNLLDWMQLRLSNSKTSDVWNAWSDLIKLIRESAADEEPEEMKRADMEPEIFETNVFNIFGETLYIIYKCFLRLMQSIDDSHLSAEEKAAVKAKVEDEYPEVISF